MTDVGRSLTGVKVRLEGSKATSTTTDGSGYYAFTDLRAGGTYTIIPVQARTKFTPLSRSFNNLMQDGSADFNGAGERDPKPDSDSNPVSKCTEADEYRERTNLIATNGTRWQRNIEGERPRIIAEIVRDGERAEATLGRLETQINFFDECKVGQVTISYRWQVNTLSPGRPARALNVPRQRRFFCRRTMLGWVCT